MTDLRQRFIQDLELAGMSPRTVEAYVYPVTRLADYFDRPPEELNEEQIREFFVHIRESKLSESWFKQALCGIRFLYSKTLAREWNLFDIVRLPHVRRLPVVLSRAEVWRIIDQVRIPVYRVCLQTLYGSGLRMSEATTLEIDQISGGRSELHIHGKGSHDRYVPIAEKTLAELRRLWKMHRSSRWLFPVHSRHGFHPDAPDYPRSISGSALQSAFRAGLKLSGVRKRAHLHSLRHSYPTHLLERRSIHGLAFVRRLC